MLNPVAPDERIHALDLLRGFAMFGVLWSNLNDWYAATKPVTSFDSSLEWMQHTLIGQRFYTLLCLLFGIGFGIQLMRAAERGMDVRAMYYRRSLVLLAMGITHALLIWSGDILTEYALVSFALLLFRTASTRRLLIASAICWVAPYVVKIVMMVAGLKIFTPSIPTAMADQILAHGSWTQIEHVRIALYLDKVAHFGWTYFDTAAKFLLGLWAMKSGYLRRAIEESRTTRRLLILALLVAASGYVIGAPWEVEGTAIAYAALLLLLWQAPRLTRMLQPLAATGRMALTTYLTQSVVCTLLFYGYGLGWYGQISYSGMLLITLALFACQMIVSTWWLTRFRFGPVEWLWRRITYGGPLGMLVDGPLP